MTPTKYQQKVLKFYARCRDSRPLYEGFRASVPQWILLGLVSTFAFWFFTWGGWPSVAWVYLGAFIGVFLRDIRAVLVFQRNWPVLLEIINWDRLHRAVQKPRNPVPGRENSVSRLIPRGLATF